MNRSILYLCRQYVEAIYGDSFLIEQERMAQGIYQDIISGVLPVTALRNELEFIREQSNA